MNMLTTGKQLTPGMTVSVRNKLYRVESVVKVTVPKGSPFIKAKLYDLATDESIEKNFKLNQEIKHVALEEHDLEYLYFEDKHYIFLDVESLKQVAVEPDIIGESANYLKEGVAVKAQCYADNIVSVDLPQFLELMITKIEGEDEDVLISDVTKIGILETGAKIEVPPFVKAGDVVKVDTSSGEYIQRV
ncbi:MAG: elongation factor P [Chlamydiota bacterium]